MVYEKFWVFLLLGFLLQVSCGFVVPRSCIHKKLTPPVDHFMGQCIHQQGDSITCLRMGVRNFIKKRILKRGGTNDVEKDDEDTFIPGVASAKAKGADAVNEEEEDERLFMEEEDEIDTTQPYDFAHESVQDKINRVKSGQMTDEEKQAFLRTSLTKGKEPLRQPLPTEESVNGRGARTSASPFPKDSILRDVIFGRGKKEEKDTSWRVDKASKLTNEEQQKKREYLKQVTDPNRFHSYTVASRGTKKPSAPPSISIAKPPSPTQEVTSASEANAPKPAPVSPPAPVMPEDLGARLGAAAMENSLRQKELQKERDRKLEEARLEEERRRKDLQRQREDEQARLEAEVLAFKQEQEEVTRRAEEEERRREEEARRREEARLKELQAAQDAYWEKKLAKERAKREGRVLEEEESEEAVMEAETTSEVSSGQKVGTKQTTV